MVNVCSNFPLTTGSNITIFHVDILIQELPSSSPPLPLFLLLFPPPPSANKLYMYYWMPLTLACMHSKGYCTWFACAYVCVWGGGGIGVGYLLAVILVTQCYCGQSRQLLSCTCCVSPVLESSFPASSLQLEVRHSFCTRMTRGQGTKAKGRKYCTRNISIVTWNIRTLVESAGGDRRICRSRSGPATDHQVPDNSTNPHRVDRKLDFLCQ